MGFKNMFSYLNLLKSTPSKIGKEVKKDFSLCITGSSDYVNVFCEILKKGMTIDKESNQKDRSKDDFVKALPIINGKTSKSIKADAVIYLLRLEDATEENLLDYKEVYKISSPARLFIEEPETYEEKEKLFKIMDDLKVAGREWISPPSEESLKEKADSILDLNKKISMPMAYRFPLFRDEMAKKIIHGTGMQNLVVAMASSLPANLPVVGIIIGFLAATGETTVITINQIKMCLQLSGIYGLEMKLIDRIKELWPLVGTAFGLRTISRTLVGFIPVAGAPIKGAIAYGGSYFVGETVRWYYKTGCKMTKEERRQLYIRAKEQAKNNVREFFKGVVEKFPKQAQEKNIDLEEVEKELQYLEKDMENVNVKENFQEEESLLEQREKEILDDK